MTLHIITGPVSSGKSTELFRLLSLHSVINNTIYYINSVLDDRTDNVYSTHGSSKLSDKAIPYKIDTLTEIIDNIKYGSVVGIDEAQFFDDLVYGVDRLLEKKCKIIVCGLCADFKMNTFGHINELLCSCDSIVKLAGVCEYCSNGNMVEAPHSLRISESNDIVDTKSTYKPVCRDCYNKKINQTLK